MIYKILKDGTLINTIVADEAFCIQYCADNGYIYEAVVEPTFEPTPAEMRENAYNTEAIVEWDGKMITVTEAAQLWQYYAAEGDADKTSALQALIAEAKADIRDRYPEV